MNKHNSLTFASDTKIVARDLGCQAALWFFAIEAERAAAYPAWLG